MEKRTPRKARRLVLPLVLAVTTVGAIAALSTTTSGCGDDGPTVDASTSDGQPDTPII